MQLLQLSVLLSKPFEEASDQGLLHGSLVQDRGEANDESYRVEEPRLPQVFPRVQEQEDAGHAFADSLRPRTEISLPILRPEEQTSAKHLHPHQA